MAVKRQLYSQYQVDIGGNDGSDDNDEEEETEAAEPAPQNDEEELLHLSQARAVIDLTAGAGAWALAALELTNYLQAGGQGGGQGLRRGNRGAPAA